MLNIFKKLNRKKGIRGLYYGLKKRMPSYLFKTVVILFGFGFAVSQVILVSAFEAHVINVTADIINGLPRVTPGSNNFCNSEEMNISISTEFPDAYIVYTLDETEPDCFATTTVYTGPFSVSETITLKAMACYDNKQSEVVTEAYEFSPEYCICGDGRLDEGEECDDGNNIDGDGCSAVCTVDECGECDGKATFLTLMYNGSGTDEIRVRQKKGAIVFDDYVSGGDTFTFFGRDVNGTLGPEITIFVNDVFNTTIHTSCSEAIYIGLVRGDFVIVAGESRFGGAFCPADSYCGDGTIDFGEECDDGNNNDGDGCSVNCTTEGGEPYCGDGTVDEGEECDDGNNEDGDGCSANCSVKEEECGICDGKVSTLTLRYDGSGSDAVRVEQKEQLVVYEDTVDPGGIFTFVGIDKKDTLGTEIYIFINNVLNTTIHTSCSEELYIGQVKGDFTIMSGESRNGGAFCPYEPVCGNKIVDVDEECDDGNNEDGDGCSAICAIDSGNEGPYCGDGTTDIDEECDDGNDIDGDGCSANCTIEFTLAKIIENLCGDGTVDPGEECDDGNDIDGDGCSSTCTIEEEPVPEPYCGDGAVDLGEECDDNNNIDEDGCSSICTIEEEPVPEPYCGDGAVDPGEECDDGNDIDEDGCTLICTIKEEPIPESYCGDGIVDEGEECDDGNNEDSDGCSAQCITEVPVPVCGDNTVDPGEECDDGNDVDGDGCSAVCGIETETQPEG